jgi:hypothetical protein
MTFVSGQTYTARRVAQEAEGRLRAHRRICHACQAAAIDVDYCAGGWALNQAAQVARQIARNSADLDRTVPAGQETLFP